MIVTYFRYEKLRKKPGDILFAITISETVLVIHW
jgi:hypothetical protein